MFYSINFTNDPIDGQFPPHFNINRFIWIWIWFVLISFKFHILSLSHYSAISYVNVSDLDDQEHLPCTVYADDDSPNSQHRWNCISSLFLTYQSRNNVQVYHIDIDLSRRWTFTQYFHINTHSHITDKLCSIFDSLQISADPLTLANNSSSIFCACASLRNHMKYAYFRLHSLNEIAFTNISIVLDEQFELLLIELKHIESLRVKVLPECRTWKKVRRMWSNVEGRRKLQTLRAIHMNAVDLQFSLENYYEIWQFLNI